jgi:hypothetical protein
MTTTIGDGRDGAWPETGPDLEAGRQHHRDAESRLQRRDLIRAGFAGLGSAAAAGLLPLTGKEAWAAPADPDHGPLVTPNPIRPLIQKSGIAVELVDFSTPPRTSAKPPYTQLNFLYHVGDGSGRLFTNDTRGKIWQIDRSTGRTRLFLDLAAARVAAFVDSTTHIGLGLRSFAFHPDFARPGTRGHRKLYTINAETPASWNGTTPLFTDDYPVHHHDVLAEWSVDPGNPARVLPESRREILRFAMWSFQHNADQLMFNPHAWTGGRGYGKMYLISRKYT